MANAPSNPNFDVAGARQAGYSDSEIIQHLQHTRDESFDADGARKAGYSDGEIADFLSKKPPQTLAQRIKAKFPGQYDDMDDATLESKVIAKYPQYSDLPRTKDTAPNVGLAAPKRPDAIRQDFPDSTGGAGEQKNDVGNTVIVPKTDEDFADTVKRAAAQGKKTTQAQIDAEVATMPAKAAETVAAAPVIGAAGTAALASPSMAPDAIKAVKAMAQAHPAAAKLIRRVLAGAIAGHEFGKTAQGAAIGALLDIL